MSNRLKMAQVQAILGLHGQGWSQRRIARELGVDRETVARHVGRAAKPAKLPTGSEGGEAGVASGGGELATVVPALADPAVRRRSDCEPWRTLIEERVALGLSAKRIHQDLVSEYQAGVGYDSVRRFIQRLPASRPWPMRRLECAAGDEVQVDFGSGAPLVLAEGRRRKTHVFRVVLSHSRKAYSEAVFQQTTDEFLRCLENAFWFFGGVPKTVVIDNLRAAVAHPDWFDPELVPKLQAFAAHYGTVILPTRPRTPRHKGKIERGIGYVKGNALKARTFGSLEEQNQFLREWEERIADTRIHGTTKRQVGQVFVEREQPALWPLPRERFAMFHEGQRIVSRDGHVEVAKAYYSVPPEYLGRTVWVRWDTRLVRVFNQRFEQIALHVRHEPGRFSTQAPHIVQEKISGLEHGAARLLAKVSVIGPHTRRWSEAMLTARGIEGTRVLLGLWSLAKKHSAESLEHASEIALSHGEYRLRSVRKLLDREAAKQLPLAFLDEHPLIRPLSDYARVVTAAWQRHAPRPESLALAETGFLRHSEGVPSTPQQHSPDREHDQGCAATSGTRPRPEYPLSSCGHRPEGGPAELDSVSPGGASVDTAAILVPWSPCSQECSHE